MVRLRLDTADTENVIFTESLAQGQSARSIDQVENFFIDKASTLRGCRCPSTCGRCHSTGCTDGICFSARSCTGGAHWDRGARRWWGPVRGRLLEEPNGLQEVIHVGSDRHCRSGSDTDVSYEAGATCGPHRCAHDAPVGDGL